MHVFMGVDRGGGGGGWDQTKKTEKGTLFLHQKNASSLHTTGYTRLQYTDKNQDLLYNIQDIQCRTDHTNLSTVLLISGL